jgi:hypothetical protein
VAKRDESSADVVRDALDRLVRERVARKPGGHLIEGQLRDAELRLPLPPSEAGEAQEDYARRLVSSIDSLLTDLVQQAAAFRPGHVWCHRCESSSCEHSYPTSSRQVFAGYTPTGLPRWEDFAQLCLERKHPQVDQLYDDPPTLLTAVEDGATLHGQMLAVFDNGSYELLGQLSAGFFSVRARAEEGRGVLALTVQVAASRARGKRVRLGLNLLGRAPSGEDLERLWDRHEELPWRKAVRWAQAALSTLNSGRGHSRATLERRVDRILQGLARRLERDHRARSRRTRHAELRHASGRRPTPKALDDARGVSGDSLFVDERSGAVVVLGDRGRTHFFTTSGRLVSSVRYSRDAIERKLKSELWRPASDELLAEFLSKLPG